MVWNEEGQERSIGGLSSSGTNEGGVFSSRSRADKEEHFDIFRVFEAEHFLDVVLYS